MSTEPSPTHGGEPLPAGERPARQRRPRLPVIAVAAAVLVAGGGGAWWASTAYDGGSGTAGDASQPPPLTLDGLAANGHGGDGDEGTEDGGRPGIAPGEPHPQVYKANTKLPEGPGSAPVYRSPASVSRSTVSALAEALDVQGTPRKQHDRWVVGEDGKSADDAALTVNNGRLAGNWTYQSGDWPVMPCGKPLPTVPRGDLVPPDHGDAPRACPGMPDSGKGGDAVSEKKAKSSVQRLLKTLKLTDATLDAGVTTGSSRMVTATPKIAGMPAKDWNSTFTVDDDGKVVRGHGNLGALRKGATYPVLSAEQTLKQLNKQGAAHAVREPRAYEGEGARASKDAPGTVAPRKALKVTGAEFGLVTRYTSGKPVLVPSWIYRVELGGGQSADVAHPAVEPEYLKPARPAPTGPGGGSDSGTGSGSGSGSDTTQQPGSPGTGAAQAVNSYAADGRTVKLTFWGGVCGGYKASAEESGKTVKISVRPKDPDPKRVCVKMAKRMTLEVELDKALGDRKVVDAADGEALPEK
ncbi:hypothetical protein [Streptomyces nanshensis]|uniref:Large membrane protein n=1 Tax=Streptomyces nanshensis TaxID=518642 RepID=A0A1E7L0Z2_9ACTN|nr:hypothetical protein [Streptomyces nanshensis]OEV09846.1 hypothetical protein AN218_20335 [Streptomyces nanshensis]